MVRKKDMSEEATRKKRRRTIALVVGMVLALICRSLPPQYHVACNSIVSLCTGGHL